MRQRQEWCSVHRNGLGILTAALCLLNSCATKSTNFPYGTFKVPDILEAALFDPLTSLYPDTQVSSGAALFVDDIPRNAAGSVVLMVRVRNPKDIFRIELTGDDAEQISFSELQDIPVLENTGFIGKTEKNLGFDNRHIIRHAPFSIFEVLMPSSPDEFSGKNVYAFYLKRRISKHRQAKFMETQSYLHKWRINFEK